MIEISNISLTYDNNEILKDISYKFRKGKIYGLIGKNGAGKSSLLKTISRINRDSEGEIKLKGVSIKDKDYLELAISFVGDTPVYYQDLTVKEHLLLICSIKKIPRKIAINKIDTLLDLLKLDRYSGSFPNSLSRGTLDPVQVSIVEDLILQLKKENRTFLISSHDIDSLKAICDTYLILKDGKLLEYSPNEIDKNNISKLINDSYGD